jgi:hypothetical protein
LTGGEIGDDSGSGDSDSGSHVSYGSNLVISPSRITLINTIQIPIEPDPLFLSTDVVSPTPIESPVSIPVGSFGPARFAFLEDDLFERSSESSEES